MHHGHKHLNLRGIKLMPMYAGFAPNSPELDPLWEYCTRNRLAVVIHTGTTFVRQAPLACTLPRLLDDVAIRFPDVKMVLAHLGHPYEGECVGFQGLEFCTERVQGRRIVSVVIKPPPAPTSTQRSDGGTPVPVADISPPSQ